MPRIRFLILLLLLCFPLFAQYNFNFVCVSDTFQTGTDYFVYYFRLTNTGTLPDIYAFDCRVIDSVPGWFEQYCAGGQCGDPGMILYDTLPSGAVDSLIEISVIPATGQWGTEKLNLLVWSLHNPVLRDSINVYAAMEQGVGEDKRREVERVNLEVFPNPFTDKINIKFVIRNPKSETNSNFQIPNHKLKIYDATGRMVKQFKHLTNYRFNGIMWAGDDEFGNILPDGVYIICLETRGFKAQKVVVKLE